MKMILVYITNPTRKEAEKVASHLLKRKLIACANIFPIESVFRWKGRINRTKEYVVIAKTLSRNFQKIKKEVRRIHKYEIPCIIRIKADASREFERWVKEEVE